jgi:hypothetical protein
MPFDPDSALVPLFKNIAIKNEGKSAAEGRPIYDDMEIVEIRGPGTRNWQPFPAHAFARWVTDPATGEQTQQTYAERFAHQYAQFKQRQQQTKAGTPLEHAPFLTEARRAELRASNIYTIEQLVHLDGQELKNLGIGGRDLKNRATEYIEEAKGNASNTQLAAELEAMRAKAAVLEEDNAALKRAGNGADGPFEDMSDDAIRKYIKTHTGHEPQGDLPRKTLVRMAADTRPTKAA